MCQLFGINVDSKEVVATRYMRGVDACCASVRMNGA